MTEAAGWWALTGVVVQTQNAISGLLGPMQRKTLKPNDKAFAVKVWQCQNCGNLQLFEAVAD